jgi:predicted heme/steroid binding protein
MGKRGWQMLGLDESCGWDWTQPMIISDEATFAPLYPNPISHPANRTGRMCASLTPTHTTFTNSISAITAFSMADASVRQRSIKPNQPKSKASPSKDASTLAEAEDQTRIFSPLDILRILFILSGALLATSFYLTSGDSLLFGYKPWFTNPSALAHWWHGSLNLTPEQLALFNGTDPKLPIYLSINGTVFDVSEGRHTYGPGGSYNVFAGRDATRAFVTGCFLEDRTSDLRGAEEVYLPIEDEEEKISNGERKTRAERERREAKKRVIAEVQNWVGFYGKHKKYFEVGKVVGTPIEYTGPAPTLCEHAAKGRPKRSKMNKSKEAKSESPGKPVQ